MFAWFRSQNQLCVLLLFFKDWIEEVKVLLNTKGNDIKIRDSYKQMFKKLFDVDKKGLNSDGVQVGSIRRKIAKV